MSVAKLSVAESAKSKDQKYNSYWILQGKKSYLKQLTSMHLFYDNDWKYFNIFFLIIVLTIAKLPVSGSAKSEYKKYISCAISQEKNIKCKTDDFDISG